MIFNIILQDQNPHLRFHLSRYFKQKRLSLCLSQKTAAEKLHLSESQYRNIETGKSEITEETLKRLFDILTLDADELFEIFRISKAAYVNAVARELCENYPP